MRDLKEDEVEKLVLIDGICTQVKSKVHKQRVLSIKCGSCGLQKEIRVRPGLAGQALPQKCEGPDAVPQNPADQDERKCPPYPYRIQPDACTYWDQQEVKFQELPEDVPHGDMPRAVTLILNRDLVD